MITDLDKLLADATATAKAARGWARALDNIADLRPEDARDAARAIRGFVGDVEGMAEAIERFRQEFARLARERDATAKALELLLSEATPQIVPCEDHPVLDVIAARLANGRQDDPCHAEDVTRESECVEFRDPDGRRFEILVRPIPDAEDRL
jgi:catechol 2,3-dioxygenase-like lactoylglutathione lyase family enzyme